MSVTQANIVDPTLKLYFGTSTERGAMDTSGAAVGSKFYESNTFLEYVWTGTWVKWELHSTT